jgi:hypothetical protein
MRIEIECESQEEFDLKRGDLLQTIAGKHYHVDLEKSENTSGIPVQDEMTDHFIKMFEKTIANIKADVAKVLL